MLFAVGVLVCAWLIASGGNRVLTGTGHNKQGSGGEWLSLARVAVGNGSKKRTMANVKMAMCRVDQASPAIYVFEIRFGNCSYDGEEFDVAEHFFPATSLRSG